MTEWSKLTGTKFYHLTVIYPLPDYRGGKVWRCSCTCGKMVTVKEKDLRRAKVSSCGCLPPISRSTRNYGESFVTHGMSGSSEWHAWVNLRQRCNNTNNVNYKDYGGRGIKVCDRWNTSFENFIADMGRKPDPKLSIDRIKTDGDYEPGNCRWATAKQQYDNRRVVNGDT